MPSYKVFQFRAGRQERTAGTWRSPESALSWVKKDGLLSDDIKACVQTTLIIRPRPPSARGVSRFKQVTHSLAAHERTQPDTLFIAVVERDAFRQMQRVADEARDRRETDAQERIRRVAQPLQRKILLAELPASRRARIKVKTSGCWVWMTAKDCGPYRDIYRKHKGPIPEGAVVRHRCDNHHCVNPNHLELGTCADNVRDMWQRGRVYRHKNWRPKF